MSFSFSFFTFLFYLGILLASGQPHWLGGWHKQVHTLSIYTVFTTLSSVCRAMNNAGPKILNSTMCLTCSFVAAAPMAGSEYGCVNAGLKQKLIATAGRDRLCCFSCCLCHSGWHHKSHLFSDPSETRAEITAQSTLPASAACWMLTERSLIKQTGSSPAPYWTKRIPCIRLEGPDRLVSKAQTLASTGEMQTNIQPTYLEVSLKVSAKNLYNACRGEGHHRSNLRTSWLVQYSFGPVLIFIAASHEGIKSTPFLLNVCVIFRCMLHITVLNQCSLEMVFQVWLSYSIFAWLSSWGSVLLRVFIRKPSIFFSSLQGLLKK